MSFFNRGLKAEEANKRITTLDGKRAFLKAAFDSDEALKNFFKARSVIRGEPLCPTCEQHWAQAPVEYTAYFDDDSALRFSVDPR